MDAIHLLAKSLDIDLLAKGQMSLFPGMRLAPSKTNPSVRRWQQTSSNSKKKPAKKKAVVPKMSGYDSAVADNMRFMSSRLSEWTALPIKRVVEGAGPGGRPMPEFDFSVVHKHGYKTAPTLYSGDGMCGLCGHAIKNVYWIKNDKQKWVLPVGSECIGRFSEKTGDELSKEARWQQNRDLIQKMHDMGDALAMQLSRSEQETRNHPAFGSRIVLVTKWEIKEAMYLKQIIAAQKIKASSGDGNISRWLTRNGDLAQRLIGYAEALLSYKGNPSELNTLGVSYRNWPGLFGSAIIPAPDLNTVKIVTPKGREFTMVRTIPGENRQRMEKISQEAVKDLYKSLPVVTLTKAQLSFLPGMSLVASKRNPAVKRWQRTTKGAKMPTEEHREPWQLTENEFKRAEKRKKYEAIVAGLKAGKKLQIQTYTHIFPISKPEHVRFTSSGNVQIRTRSTWSTMFPNQIDWLAVQAGMKLPPREEQSSHEELVEEAIKAGKEVPKEVLADYPRLKRMAARKKKKQ